MKYKLRSVASVGFAKENAGSHDASNCVIFAVAQKAERRRISYFLAIICWLYLMVSIAIPQ